jgi:hypothetical protein
MSMGDAVALMDYWREYPPVHIILRGVHMKEGRSASNGRSVDGPSHSARDQRDDGPPMDESAMLHLLNAAQGLTDGQLRVGREMPAHLKAMVDYAEETNAKIRQSKMN